MLYELSTGTPFRTFVCENRFLSKEMRGPNRDDTADNRKLSDASLLALLKDVACALDSGLNSNQHFTMGQSNIVRTLIASACDASRPTSGAAA